jgi:LCP family protein required for cell wall assembly
MAGVRAIIERAERVRVANKLFVGLFIAFLLAAVITASLTYLAVRGVVVAWHSPNLPGIPIQPAVSGTDAPPDVSLNGDLPLQPAGGPDPVPWDGASRVYVILLGLDLRTGRAGAPHSDALILLSLDPASQTGSMLSLPGDLWVNIPGFGPDYLNNAYRIGEMSGAPGGGPGLAMRTVSALLGLPVEYYVGVDFNAFERLIDEIGGVKLDVSGPIELVPLGDRPHKILQPGVQVLPGDLALAYARAPSVEEVPLTRPERQQQVILGIRNRLIDGKVLSTLIVKAPLLYSQVSGGLRSNLSLMQAVQLAWLAHQIPEERLQRSVIGSDQINLMASPDGTEYFVPDPQRLRQLRDQLFTTTGPIAPLEASANPQELFQAEGARLSVLNGTATPGLGSRSAEYLRGQGLNVIKIGNASEHYASTTLIDYTGNPNTIKYLVELMGITPERIYHRYDPYSPVDIMLLLGDDWAANNPMP